MAGAHPALVPGLGLGSVPALALGWVRVSGWAPVLGLEPAWAMASGQAAQAVARALVQGRGLAMA